jgi:hypothetical protein
LLKGESVEIDRTSFNVDWNTLSIRVENSVIKIPGLTGDIKTIYNTSDVNFKFISFPIKYNLIVHPLYPLVIPKLIKPNNKENLSSGLAALEADDMFILFSNFEIITFLISTLLLIIMIIIYLIFIK